MYFQAATENCCYKANKQPILGRICQIAPKYTQTVKLGKHVPKYSSVNINGLSAVYFGLHSKNK
jgi:hypothetical protein